ncbi:hypothetical protein, partial [Agrobacterium sp.]|uniref:hypothetical protein n=1 Tax=Agrobacterium sp. TaxID=361 RepID=UPI004034F3AF
AKNQQVAHLLPLLPRLALQEQSVGYVADTVSRMLDQGGKGGDLGAGGEGAAGNLAPEQADCAAAAADEEELAEEEGGS